MRIEIPDFCLVLLVGASGSGKSHLAHTLFSEDEVLSADHFRKLVSGDEMDQRSTEDAFECLYHIAQKRLDRRKLTVIDATNLHNWARNKALKFAQDNNCFCIALALNIPESECQRNNAARIDKRFAPRIIKHQCAEFTHSLKNLKKENFRQVHILNSRKEINELEISRVPLWTDKSSLHGPFDIIGDVHGCYDELCKLLRSLSYQVQEDQHMAIPPQGRKAIFLGDLCDRGPASVPVLRMVMNMCAADHALCVPGNHDDKLARYLAGKKVQIANGLECSVAELEKEDKSFRKRVGEFLHSLVSHFVLDDGRLVVCHAGLPAKMQGRSSKAVREFCLYGNPTGNIDEYGLPERYDWTQDYDGIALVAYGHSPDLDTKVVNKTICLDGGCAFGGKLAALRYPEMEILSQPAMREYFHPKKPLVKTTTAALPDAQILLGRQCIETSLGINIIRDEERSLTALETMGRFAIDPRWLIYLPPTMSPCESSTLPDYLEHPLEALSYYANRGVKKIICEEKHMGSRAIAIICKDENAAKKHFSTVNEQCGIISSRTGRPFFTPAQKAIQSVLLAQIRSALDSTAFWKKYDAEWLCLDCEIMPWSYKAQTLVNKQYAPYGIAGINGLEKSLEKLSQLDRRQRHDGSFLTEAEASTMEALRSRLIEKRDSINAYNKVWQSYCQPVNGIEDIRLAPFHILASDKKVWSDVSHDRQLQIIEEHLGKLPFFKATRNRIINLENEEEKSAACAFWADLLAEGAEGMVVKPLDFVPRQGNKLLQPALKCRGREYLRIIYGSDYLKYIDKFKIRNISAKRNRALKEFALGLEALERFIRGESLPKVHECVFTILALESEAQDARL